MVTAEDGLQALEQVAHHCPDLILLDLGIPGKDGYAVLEEVRTFSDVPVIILTANDNEDDKVRGLRMGADDYLTKPFGSRELQARIEAVLRRARPVPEKDSAPGSAVYRNRDLRIDFARREVFMGSKGVHLTPTEYRLLVEFARHPNRVLSHAHLLDQVWGKEYCEDVPILRAVVWRLRRKLEPNPGAPTYIISEPGVGYQLAQG
ncbi:MAG: response regulator transcription factor [Anaerolineae bacterium]|nr:response regulator transcription factor [Anaerolineae bacterium]